MQTLLSFGLHEEKCTSRQPLLPQLSETNQLRIVEFDYAIDIFAIRKKRLTHITHRKPFCTYGDWSFIDPIILKIKLF